MELLYAFRERAAGIESLENPNNLNDLPNSRHTSNLVGSDCIRVK